MKLERPKTLHTFHVLTMYLLGPIMFTPLTYNELTVTYKIYYFSSDLPTVTYNIHYIYF